MWRSVLGWAFGPHIFELVAFFLAAIGVAMALAPEREDIARAHWFFGAAFIFVLGRIIHWLVTLHDSVWPRPVIALLLFALVGGSWMIVYEWVDGKLRKADAAHATQ